MIKKYKYLCDRKISFRGNTYHKGDVIELDSNNLGFNPTWFEEVEVAKRVERTESGKKKKKEVIEDDSNDSNADSTVSR